MVYKDIYPTIADDPAITAGRSIGRHIKDIMSDSRHPCTIGKTNCIIGLTFCEAPFGDF